MKSNIHPPVHPLVLKFPQGDTFQTSSTYKGGTLTLDVDFRLLPAWTGKGVRQTNLHNAKINKFSQRCGGNLSFLSTKTKLPK